MITQVELKEKLLYNSETGVFTWKVSTIKIEVGDIAGSINDRGYIRIVLNYKTYFAHRLAWLYVYGEWPKNQIDHINGVKDDNRIENLRDVTHSQNQQNRKEHREGSLVGTCYNKHAKKWSSKISINGKLEHLGYFKTQQQAHEAYINKLKEIENEL